MPSLRRLFRPRPDDSDAASVVIDFSELDLTGCKPRRPAEQPPHISPTTTNLFDTFPRVRFGGYRRYYEALQLQSKEERAIRLTTASEADHRAPSPVHPEPELEFDSEESAETDDPPHSPLPIGSIRRAKPFEPALGAIEELLVDDMDNDPWSWHSLPLPNLHPSNSTSSNSSKRASSQSRRRSRRNSSGSHHSHSHSPRASPRNSIIGTPALANAHPMLRKKPRIRRGSLQISTPAPGRDAGTSPDDDPTWPEWLRPYSHSPSSSVSSTSSSEEDYAHPRTRSHGDYISQ